MEHYKGHKLIKYSNVFNNMNIFTVRDNKGLEGMAISAKMVYYKYKFVVRGRAPIKVKALLEYRHYQKRGFFSSLCSTEICRTLRIILTVVGEGDSHHIVRFKEGASISDTVVNLIHEVIQEDTILDDGIVSYDLSKRRVYDDTLSFDL